MPASRPPPPCHPLGRQNAQCGLCSWCCALSRHAASTPARVCKGRDFCVARLAHLSHAAPFLSETVSSCRHKRIGHLRQFLQCGWLRAPKSSGHGSPSRWHRDSAAKTSPAIAPCRCQGGWWVHPRSSVHKGSSKPARSLRAFSRPRTWWRR